jgi:DNA-nicking Smr family endonuclease
LRKKAVNGPFSQLDVLLKKAGIRLQPANKPGEDPAPLPDSQLCQTQSEEEIFVRAMAGVARTLWPRPQTDIPQLPPLSFPDSGAEGRRLMEAAVAGEPVLTVLDHPEYIEGWVGVAGKRYLPSLRNGMYSIQGTIDLHGLNREEARQAVEEFIARMSRFRPCCVKIIHGRGINSPNDRAILKESLQRWLSTRRLSKQIVAYASAPLNDGGVGAIYVLLRTRT